MIFYLTNSIKYSIIIVSYDSLAERECYMSKLEKLLFKMRNQPNGIRFAELRIVLENHGYLMKCTTRNIS